MSRRPVTANPVRRRNDVQRRMWSESPIPRLATRRVRMAGAVVPEPLCDDEDWVITSQTSTTVRFEGVFGVSGALSIDIIYDCTATGDVEVEARAYCDGVWSSWLTYTDGVTGPDTGVLETTGSYFGTSCTVTAIEVRWDVADAFATLCVSPVDNT